MHTTSADILAAGNYVITSEADNSIGIVPLVSCQKTSSYQRYFCVLEYQNPSVRQPQPRFYKAGAKTRIKIPAKPGIKNGALQLQGVLSKKEYVDKVNFLKSEIQNGNIYEINYCIEFCAEDVIIDPLSIYVKLNKLTNAPYSRLVRDGSNFIICASPELFLKKEGRILSTKPIKGTIKRGSTEEEDEMLRNQLFNSLKERTENVMAVDVARNDLSRLAERGTVRVNKLYNIESYQTVHQMVSTVSCEISENISFEKIIDATFPMASMTGAPKVKAMELIDTTESFTRNYYSGAIGFIEENGDFELAVTIRSIFYNEKTKRLSIAVGSAITHLCDPEHEYEECLLKAGALLKALNAEILEA